MKTLLRGYLKKKKWNWFLVEFLFCVWLVFVIFFANFVFVFYRFQSLINIILLGKCLSRKSSDITRWVNRCDVIIIISGIAAKTFVELSFNWLNFVFLVVVVVVFNVFCCVLFFTFYMQHCYHYKRQPNKIKNKKIFMACVTQYLIK